MDLLKEYSSAFAALFIGFIAGGWNIFLYFDRKFNKHLETLEKKFNEKIDISLQKLEENFDERLKNIQTKSSENKKILEEQNITINNLRSDVQTKYLEKAEYQSEIKDIKQNIIRILDRQNDNRKELEQRFDKLISVILETKKN